jgi:hypothetical protein
MEIGVCYWYPHHVRDISIDFHLLAALPGEQGYKRTPDATISIQNTTFYFRYGYCVFVFGRLYEFYVILNLLVSCSHLYVDQGLIVFQLPRLPTSLSSTNHASISPTWYRRQ